MPDDMTQLDPEMLSSMMLGMGNDAPAPAPGGTVLPTPSPMAAPAPVTPTANADSSSGGIGDLPDFNLPPPPPPPDMSKYGPARLGNPAMGGHGGFRGVMADILYQATQSMKKAYNLPTDAELAQQDYASQMQNYQAQVGAIHQRVALANVMSEIAKRKADMNAPAEPAKETPAQSFQRLNAIGKAAGLQGADLLNFSTGKEILKPDKPVPNTTEAQLAADAASSDPVKAAAAQKALKILAQTKQNSLRVTVNAGGTDGTLSGNDAAMVANLRSGKLTLDAVKKLYPGPKLAGRLQNIITAALTPDENGKAYNPNAQLNPTSQQNLQQTNAALDNVNHVMKVIEDSNLQNNDSQLDPQKWKDVLKYKSGQGTNSPYAQAFASISLGGLKDAAALLKGSSRAWAALDKALEHTPSIYYTPRANYQRLQEIKMALKQVQEETLANGSKSGLPNTVDNDPLGIRK
jgi:hypothetical protein